MAAAAEERLLRRVRTIALALPEANERASHGMPTFWIADRKTFASFAQHHHGDPHVTLWFAAPPGAQQALIASDSARFFLPPYVAHRGWAGLRLDVKDASGPDLWILVRDVLCDAHETVAASMPVARRKRS